MNAALKRRATHAVRSTTRTANLRAHQLEERRQKFVETAEKLFLQHGYAGTSVNEIVRVAGGSLATLYASFGTKEKLFEAVMTQRVRSAFDGAQQTMRGAGSIRAELAALAREILDRTLSTDSLAIYRLAVAEGPRFADLRKAVIESGMQQFLTRLADYFAQLSATGRLGIDAPALAAERFLALAQGQAQFIAGCGEGKRYTAKRRAQHAAEAVDAFLRIYPAAP